MFDLPRSARLVSWFNAWLSGCSTPDDLADLVVAPDAAHSVVGLSQEPQSLMLALAQVRRLGGGHASLALPVPGDLVGLAGPVELNMAAVDAGEAAVFASAGVALVPEVVGAGVFWRAHPSNRRAGGLDVGGAERQLRETLIDVADRLTALDLATWRPEISAALSVVRDEHDAPLPAGYPVRAVRLAALALRCRAIVALAEEAGATGVTSYELTGRDTALQDLARAVRQALVAACSTVPGLDDARAR